MGAMHETDKNGNTLDSLFAAYREACPAPDGSAEFMPKLWQRIEARRVEATTSIFRRLAQVCVAATAVLVILTTVMMPSSSQDSEVFYSSTYADVLAADLVDQAYVQALPADLPGVN